MQLVIIRHGEQDFTTGGLSKDGRDQVQALAEKLKSSLTLGKIFLAHSDTQRTTETVEILENVLEVKKRLSLSWLKDGDLAGRRARALTEDNPAFTTSIIVSHLPVINEILGAFAKDFNMDDPPKGPDHAEAIVVDVEKQTLTRF